MQQVYIYMNAKCVLC